MALRALFCWVQRGLTAFNRNNSGVNGVFLSGIQALTALIWRNSGVSGDFLSGKEGCNVV